MDMSHMEKTIEWVTNNFDISDDVFDRVYNGETLTKRTSWMSFCPNGLLFEWGNLSMRERAIIVSVIHHNYWDQMR